MFFDNWKSFARCKVVIKEGLEGTTLCENFFLNRVRVAGSNMPSLLLLKNATDSIVDLSR